MGLRYGLLATLTLVLACALVWDVLHPPRPRALHSRPKPDPADLVRIVVGGTAPPLPRRGPAPAPPEAERRPPGAPLPPQDPPSGPAPERTVRVAPGDTLGGIAERTLGTSRRAEALARHNGLDPDGILRAGAVLRIPGPPPEARPAPEAAAPGPVPAPAVPSAVPASRVIVPDTPVQRHRVAEGDTLYGLARRYLGDGSRFREIAADNGLDPGAPLRIGRELRIRASR